MICKSWNERILDALKNHVFDSITPAKLIRLSGLENPENEYITGEDLVTSSYSQLSENAGVRGN